MVRLAASLAAALLLLPAFAAQVLAAPPTHEYAPAGPIEFAAGEVCEFPVLLEATVDTGKTTTFAAAADGSQRIVTRGFAANIATNLATGAEIAYSGGYRIAILIAADGSVTAHGTGSLTAWYFEGDPSELGYGMWEIQGHAVERYGSDGSFLGATFYGHATNVCEALAG